MSTLGVLMRLFWTRSRQGTLGVPRVTPGVPGPGAKTLIRLVHYLKGAKAHFSASISVSETLRESLPSSLVCVSVVGANCALVT